MTENHLFIESYSPLSDDDCGIVRLCLSTGVSPSLTDHIVDGEVVFPMTGQGFTLLPSSVIKKAQRVST